ncbi:hypothetical protein AMECASPLE_003110 [Ameca splendens]|uniref:Uncharacterized protein n=1 Tax=Ameca splendens TaxID=208324 RepID=A0ABV0ZX94_9TELE
MQNLHILHKIYLHNFIYNNPALKHIPILAYKMEKWQIFMTNHMTGIPPRNECSVLSAWISMSIIFAEKTSLLSQTFNRKHQIETFAKVELQHVCQQHYSVCGKS